MATVNEFALIKLRDSYDDLDFLELIMQCQEIQDSWSRQHQPHALSHKPYNALSSFFIQKSSPNYLLITAPWESIDAHREWIESSENTSVFARLSEYIAPTCDSVFLFHMEPAGMHVELRGDLFAKEQFSVCRLSVDANRREAVHNKYRNIEEEVVKMGSDRRIWAGWRIEKIGDREDLVVFWNHFVPDDQVKPLFDMTDTKDIRSFQHIV